MPRFCIRSAWIVSPRTRQCTNFAPAFRPSSIVLNHVIRTIHIAPFSRYFTSYATRQLHNSPLARDDSVPSEYKYTVGQIARAASQAVRVAADEGNVRDAYYVVHSMLQSPLEPGVKAPVSSRRLLNPMNFGRPIPTRLAVHCLVHSLMRKGYTIEAGREIQKMVAIGVRFRSRTIEANVGLLCSGPSRPLEDDILPAEKVLLETPTRSSDPTGTPRDSRASRALEKRSAKLNPEMRLALNLLSTARQSRHRRTKRMYGWLVDACLLQGEIVVGTLLFVLLVKDWQLRRVLKSLPAEQGDTDNSDSKYSQALSTVSSNLGLPSRTCANQARIGDPSFFIPYPAPSILDSILDAIDRNMFLPEPQRSVRSDALEALSILADLLDQRSLPSGALSRLIRVLSSCPSSPRQNTRFFRNGRQSHLSVYDHVHEVLLRMCRSLPSRKPEPSLRHPEVLPPIDIRSYNSLLHYALRHRLSPALADTVIEHMTRHREVPLQPDVVTYNIILRSASLLRNNYLANQVLKKFQNAEYPITAVLPGKLHDDILPTSSAEDPSTQPLRGFSLTLHQAADEHMTIPDIPTFTPPKSRSFQIDPYTLSSYITHLVSIGQPYVVADMIFHLLPELHVIDHPADDSPSAQESHRQWAASRQECILHAATYGPHMFSAVLNALQKAGKTGLAERVWLLAQEAERASWVPSDRLGAPAPWCLSIHSYTSMMKCYVSESKKGVALVCGSRYPRSLSSSLSLQRERKAWVPRQTKNIYVRGWAYFFLRMQAREQGFEDSEPPLRWKTSREVGHLLLKSMRGGALSVWQQLMNLQPESARQYPPQWAARLASLHLPVGDARFFNAVLDMFGRRPKMQARRVRVSPSWWKRKLRITQHLYRNSGWLSMTHDHNLVEIARGMAQAGFPFPLGLQRALVGRVTFRIRDGGRQDDRVRPLKFPRPTRLNFRPFAIPVTKSRGLPLGRRKPLTGRRRRRQRTVE